MKFLFFGKYFFFLLFLVFLCIQDPPLTHATNTKEKETYQTVKKILLSVLRNENPKKAIETLRLLSKKNDTIASSCHPLAHELGQKTYEKYHDFQKAMTYQDDICNSGYIHGVIEAYFQNTNEILSDMKHVCLTQKKTGYMQWQCSHGIGHGVMLYTQNDLPKAITLCHSLSQTNDIKNCINGVFMENFNTNQKIHPSEYLKKNDPLYPCSDQKEQDKSTCYYYAPTYYLSLHKNDYTRALKLCRQTKEYQDSCTAGVGGQAMKNDMNHPLLVESICMKAPVAQVSPCIVGMIGIYINHYASLKPADKLCDKLQKPNITTCKQVIKNESRNFLL